MMKTNMLVAVLGFCTHSYVTAQNVGIGTTNPTRAKLEIVGFAGVGATVAMFGGETAGVTMQSGWPTIGYNQYLDDVSTYGKYMANGYAAIQFLHPAGIMFFDIFPSGTINTHTGPATGRLELNHTGKLTVRGGLHLSNLSITSDKTGAGKNMLPIGMASVQAAGGKNFGSSDNISTSWVTDHYEIELNESVTGVIPVINVLSSTTARIATYVLGAPTKIWVYVWSGGAKTQSAFSIVVFRP